MPSMRTMEFFSQAQKWPDKFRVLDNGAQPELELRDFTYNCITTARRLSCRCWTTYGITHGGGVVRTSGTKLKVTCYGVFWVGTAHNHMLISLEQSRMLHLRPRPSLLNSDCTLEPPEVSHSAHAGINCNNAVR